MFAPIREGMAQMAQTLRTLRESPIPLACKTGSPQLAGTLPDGTHYTNSVLIGYGPVQQPRFAVAVVIEYGGGGSNGRARSAGCGGLVCSSRNGLNRMEFCGEFLLQHAG